MPIECWINVSPLLFIRSFVHLFFSILAGVLFNRVLQWLVININTKRCCNRLYFSLSSSLLPPQTLPLPPHARSQFRVVVVSCGFLRDLRRTAARLKHRRHRHTHTLDTAGRQTTKMMTRDAHPSFRPSPTSIQIETRQPQRPRRRGQ